MAQLVQLNTYIFSISKAYKKVRLNMKDVFTDLGGKSIKNSTELIQVCRDFLELNLPTNQNRSNINLTKNYKFKFFNVDPSTSTVYGMVTGGITGIEGELDKYNGTITPIEITDTTAHPFFFSMHFPINKDFGILMIQKYSNSALTTELKMDLQKAFGTNKYTIRIDPYLSPEMKEAFKKKSYVESITFTKRNARGSKLNSMFSFVSKDKNYVFEIKISEMEMDGSTFQDKITQIEKNQYIKNLKDIGITEYDDYKTKVVFKDQEGNTSRTELHKAADFVEKLLPRQIYDYSVRPKIKEEEDFDYTDIKKICDNLLVEINKNI